MKYMKGQSATPAVSCVKGNQEGNKMVPQGASAFIKIMSNFIILSDTLRSGRSPGDYLN